jgi:hypothetical protein
MTKRVVGYLSLCLLASCTFGGPQDVILKGVPVVSNQKSGTQISQQQAATTRALPADFSEPQLSSFEVAYKIAAIDDYLIASGMIRAGEKLDNPPPEVNYETFPFVVKAPSISESYSPLDFSTCPNATSAEVKAGTVVIPPVCVDPTTPPTSPKQPGKQVAKNPPTASSQSWTLDVAATTTVTIKLPNGQTITQTLNNTVPPKAAEKIAVGHEIPGSSYQSIHARQMALQGISLADRYCQEWFEKKGLQQSGTTLASDISGSIVSSAASIGGLVSGTPAAPAAVGLLNGLTSNGANIINKDFLYGSDNISTTFESVRQAEATDKATALPEPDNSDWTFAQAVTVIEQHQDICHTNNILALLKKQVQSSTITTNKAVCPTDPSRPATRSQVVIASKAGSDATSSTAAVNGASCNDMAPSSSTNGQAKPVAK